MIYIGYNMNTDMVESIAYFTKYEELSYDYVEVGDNKITVLMGNNFKIINWLNDGLELEPGYDFLFRDGDHDMFKHLFRDIK